ncbi:hypothetical protein BCR32DRAFT_273742 [Anaeromyces robustus]|uniref:Ankyrin n=1 Tax=Anaeromyces robustus TaxID=1754192 RepID=A0A1Y1XSA7_9FUNG|nr:hypothetical protein BCR32DRAFT_273742 [Anaeromyces robustus]|eukprot:ORX88194.1 hypothetical protein BCR32DRAFT_273742 [Anaeromyces robustus]
MKSNNNKNINKNNKNNNNNHINNDNSNNSNPNNKLTISKGIKKKETILCTYFHLNNNKFSLLKILDDKSIPYEKPSFFQILKYHLQNETPEIQKIYSNYNEIENEKINIQNKNLIERGNTDLLHKYIKDKNISLKSLNSTIEFDNYGCLRSDMGFDILIYAIERKAPYDMIRYIVETTPYTDLDYGKVKNKDEFCVPLFTAIGNNDFKVADYLISKGADIHYEFRSDPWNIGSEYNENPSKLSYCSIVDENFELDYEYYIRADVVNYLLDYNRLNHENKKYLIKKGVRVNIDIDELAREKQREIEERQRRYEDIIRNLLGKN